MRLTKTQHELLTRAVKHPHGVIAIISGVVSSRRNGRYGVRERDAAYKLGKAGLLQHIETHASTHHLCHGFGSDYGHEAVYRITDSGRQAIEN